MTDIADLVAPRLTDDELTALLEAHRVCDGCVSHCGRHCRKCQGFQSNDWPCEPWRLAAEVRELLKVARAIAKEPDELVSGAILEIARRYEERGR